jgi:hypothetical protein
MRATEDGGRESTTIIANFGHAAIACRSGARKLEKIVKTDTFVKACDELF